MQNKLMLGLWRFMINVPAALWEKEMEKGRKKFEEATRFMTPEHRLVHHFVVRELPFAGKPLAPEFISTRLEMAAARVKAVLDDLEKRMTFLFRNRSGEVVWAYPVTVEQTPHRVTFSTGERLYAA